MVLYHITNGHHAYKENLHAKRTKISKKKKKKVTQENRIIQSTKKDLSILRDSRRQNIHKTEQDAMKEKRSENYFAGTKNVIAKVKCSVGGLKHRVVGENISKNNRAKIGPVVHRGHRFSLVWGRFHAGTC